MYLEPNKLRLAHLRLDGYPPLTQVIFCPHCSFQHPPQSAGPNRCPVCDSTLHVTTVTRDLVELVTGHEPVAWSLRRNWFMSAAQ